MERLITKAEFNEWWDSGDEWIDNPYYRGTPMFWAWEGWHAGVKAEREACAKVAEAIEKDRFDAVGDPRISEFNSQIAFAIRERGAP